ncbi:hypothetical protein [Mycolicibacterium sp.]|uniref:hypothetical protein n=1 Tax=Mycolicibacterium sp. TaxID=2320850 RepID=UPI001A1D5DD0|nr:hypothetical protein [Mycolicibacterium sp.]MBJ7341415.1 hypothetical protein [Mycolicibacterium sp.]
MVARMRIAAAACVVMSGLFVGSVGAAMAFADPGTDQGGETGGTPTDPTAGGAAAPSTEQAPPGETAVEPVPAATPTVTAPKPTSQVGDGRNGLPSDDGASPDARPSSKLSSPAAGVPSQTTPTATGESTPPKSAGATATAVKTTTETTTPGPAPTLDQPPTENVPPTEDDEHQGWHWPWCWPTLPSPPPGTGTPASGGNGGGGGVSVGKPPIGVGIPEPPPLMQLPAPVIPKVVPPTLPVISVDPVVDVISGLATAAAELPFVPLTLPVIVPPLGAGAAGAGGGGGSGSSGGGPRPMSPPAPKTSGGPQNKSQPPGAQSPPAFSAGNRPVPASYRAGYGEYLRSAGVGQMAAVAVPGVTGILVLTGAGGVVGYRQARAGHAVRANGTARFMG